MGGRHPRVAPHPFFKRRHLSNGAGPEASRNRLLRTDNDSNAENGRECDVSWLSKAGYARAGDGLLIHPPKVRSRKTSVVGGRLLRRGPRLGLGALLPIVRRTGTSRTSRTLAANPIARKTYPAAMTDRWVMHYLRMREDLEPAFRKRYSAQVRGRAGLGGTIASVFRSISTKWTQRTEKGSCV